MRTSQVFCPRAIICPSLRAMVHLRPLNGAHNRHTGCRGDQVLSGFERGVIDRACQWPRKVKQGLDQWLDAVVLRALFTVDERFGDIA